MSLKDKAKFGVGYLTDAEEKNAFVLADDRVRFDKNGAGGAVKVEGYRGIWPVFGKTSERLGGADVVIVHDEDEGGATGALDNTAGASGSRVKIPSIEGENEGLESNSTRKGIHFAKRPTWMCSVKSSCSPCEKSELHRPYCQPYGNRALIECRKIEVTKTPERKPLPPSKEEFKPGGREKVVVDKINKIGTSNTHQGRNVDSTYGASIEEILERGESNNLAPILGSGLVTRDEMFVSGHVYKGYQVCGKDRARETWDYAEFLGVNLILALIGIYVLLTRQRYLAGQHQSMLARRIGRT